MDLRYPLDLAQGIVGFARHNEADQALSAAHRLAVQRVTQQDRARAGRKDLAQRYACAKAVGADHLDDVIVLLARQRRLAIVRQQVGQAHTAENKWPRCAMPGADNITIGDGMARQFGEFGGRNVDDRLGGLMQDKVRILGRWGRVGFVRMTVSPIERVRRRGRIAHGLGSNVNVNG